MSTERRVDPQTRRQGSARALSMEIHPAAALFPLMSDSELTELAEDIKKNGLLEAITLHEGKVLDGRNRLAACELAGVEPRFEEWSGIGELPTRYVIAKNLQRRQLTLGQKAAIAAECVPMLSEEARQRSLLNLKRGNQFPSRPIGLVGESGVARVLAARQVGVSETSLQRAIEVKEADPEEFERLKRGEVTPHAAHAKVKAKMPPRTTAAKLGRLDEIRALARDGHNALQISTEVGVGEEHVRRLARRNGIPLPAEQATGKSIKKLDASRVIRQTVNGAENLIVGLEMVDGAALKAEESEIKRWVASLNESIRVLSKLVRHLRSINGK